MFDLTPIRNNTDAIKQQLSGMKNNNIKGIPLSDYIFNKLITTIDPIEYCHRVLRNHLPENRKYLHANQVELIRAVANPRIRRVAALMARQSGKTESIASFVGYLLDNYPQMRIGVFTPRIQQAEINVGRTAVFFQMNEALLNNKLIKCTKDKIELSNGSYVMAVSGSDQSNIEGLTFDIIILDEAQKITDYTWSERIVPMGGACIRGDSLIALPSGDFITIKQLVEEKKIKEIIAINPETLKLTTANITDYVDSGIQKTLKITLDSGRIIQGTLDHPVLIKPRDTRVPKWEHLQNIKVGMQVAVPKELAYFGHVNNQDARLLGMLIGDGSYGDRQMPRYSSEDTELWNYIYNNYPDIKTTIYNSHITNKNRLFTDATLTGIIPILKNAKIYGQTKEKKRLPYNYNLYNKSSLSNLLGGLFDTDGNVYIEDNRKVIISISQSNEIIIKEIQLALLKFGIHSKIRSRISNGKHSYSKTAIPYYELSIKNKESIENFEANIKFLLTRKQEMLCKGIEILKNHKYKIQKNLLDKDLRFEKVVSIEDTGLEQVYDLTVDKIHNFIANGIVVHNTNAKLIKIGTPKTRNHFFQSMQGKESADWLTIAKDWTQCPQLWAKSHIILPDHQDPTHVNTRKYSKYVFDLMPKSLKQELFPTVPEHWAEGSMTVEDFKTQYMLQFIDGAGQFLSTDEWNLLVSGQFDWIEEGKIGENYAAGIDFAGSDADGADFTHISVVRIAPNGEKQKVFGCEFHGTSYPEQERAIAKLFGGPRPIWNCKAIYADFTGCGRPVVQSLIENFGLTNLKGITFNGADTVTHSGMNMKNVMFASLRQELDNGRFKYPTKDRFMQNTHRDRHSFYHKMIGEWRDLEYTVGLTVNKKISAPSGGHDDCPCADTLACFAALHGVKNSMPKPSGARIFRRS